MLALLLALACGRELWSQKVLTGPGADRALAPAPVVSTIEKLGALPRRAPPRAYVVEGRVRLVKLEADSDFHVVLEDEAGRTIVVEAPHPACSKGSKAYAAIVRARRQAAELRVGSKVRAVGMLFFDKLHGQTGAAPNGAELHPLFSIRAAP